MKTIQIHIEGSGWHELPADTPPQAVQEYIDCVKQYTPKVEVKTNGKAARPDALVVLKLLAGEL